MDFLRPLLDFASPAISISDLNQVRRRGSRLAFSEYVCRVPSAIIATFEPMSLVGIHFIGPLNPPAKDGSKYILVAVDYFSRFMFAEALPEATGFTVTSTWLRRWSPIIGWPRQTYSRSTEGPRARLRMGSRAVDPSRRLHPSSGRKPSPEDHVIYRNVLHHEGYRLRRRCCDDTSTSKAV